MSAVPYFCLAYWILGGIFFIFDWFRRPEMIRNYKIQPGSNDPLDKQKLLKTVKVVLFNQLVISTASFGLTAASYELTGSWDSFDVTTVPSFPKLMLNLIVCAMIYDLIFYCNHRILHHKLLYKHIHKMHHEWTAPIAIASVYSHPFEHYFCNIVPLCGPFLLRVDIASTAFFVQFILVTGCFIHCGLHLPFMMSPEFHDFHHKNSSECFSTNGLPDHIFGTSKAFLKSERAKSHKTIIGCGAIKPSQVEKNNKIIQTNDKAAECTVVIAEPSHRPDTATEQKLKY
jgi:fatty acid hydroxylase domain-containing protein 2